MAIYGETYSKFKRNEMVTNGTFEEGFTSGVADGWQHWSAGTPSQDTSIKIIGSSQKIDWVAQSGEVHQHMDFLAGITYKITGWIRFSGTPVISGLLIRTSSLGYKATIQTATVLDEWIRIDALYTPSVDNINGSIGIGSRGPITATLWMDNISVTPEVIDLRYSTIEPSWGNELLIRNKSVFTAETTFTKIADDFASFIVTVNIWKNVDPGDAMSEILPYNHTIVNFMPHEDSGIYIQKIGGGDANFYIESMTPVYVKNEPPILLDKLIIKLVSLEAVDASGSIF